MRNAMTPEEIQQLAERVARVFEEKPLDVTHSEIIKSIQAHSDNSEAMIRLRRFSNGKAFISNGHYWVANRRCWKDTVIWEPAFKLDGSVRDTDAIITARMLDRMAAIERVSLQEYRVVPPSYRGDGLTRSDVVLERDSDHCSCEFGWYGNYRRWVGPTRVLAVAKVFVDVF